MPVSPSPPFLKPRRAALAAVIASALVLLIGILALEIEVPALAAFLAQWRARWWAPGAIVLLFTILAFLGAPQIVLISATALAFGPFWGAAFSWCATMISACVGFFLGRWAGAARVAGWGNAPFMGRIATFVAKRGVISALLVRLVPTGPFVLVNAALGASGMAFWRFGLGTAAGIAPKIVLIASLGGALGSLLGGAKSWGPWLLVMGALGAMLSFGWVLAARRKKARAKPGMPADPR